MVALAIGVAMEVMLVELMVLLKPMLVVVVDGHSVAMAMRLTTSHPATTSVSLVPYTVPLRILDCSTPAQVRSPVLT